LFKKDQLWSEKANFNQNWLVLVQNLKNLDKTGESKIVENWCKQDKNCQKVVRKDQML
jgi:hypothetical protein